MAIPKTSHGGAATRAAAPARPAVESNVADYLGAAISDTLAALCIPGAAVLSATAKAALQTHYARKAQEAREIMLGELRAGRATPENVELEEFAAITVRYARAVREGVGRINLRMLAAILAGQLAHDAVYADEFYRWADILAGLTSDEIVVLAGYLRHAPADLRTARLVELASAVYQGIYGPDTARWGDFEAVRGALLRTGLLSISATGGAIGGGSSVVFAPTSKLQELGRLVEMEGVLERSGLSGGGPHP
ncbi:hypothetical protein [Achromobacter marplatensis]|uniref:hypothetical protein n=1 Tax=Achromobacter marplatensis TaxID=470868 RepID=UPI0028E50960|nr:hypothetical protein [Achromobacter marplatensis]